MAITTKKIMKKLKPKKKQIKKMSTTKTMTLSEKLLIELKSGKKTLQELQKKFGKKTHLTLIDLVDARIIGSVVNIPLGEIYYIK